MGIVQVGAVALLVGCGSPAARVSKNPAASAPPPAAATQSASSAPRPSSGVSGVGPAAVTPIPACDSPTRSIPAVQRGRAKIPISGLGSGPVYWSGQLVWYTGGATGVVIVDPSAGGPVSVTFVGPGGGGQATFRGQSLLVVQPTPAQWTYVAGTFVPSIPGCWTMHATIGAHTSVVRFSVVGGVAPSG